MTRILSAILVIVFILLSGLVHGIWTSRWQLSTALEESMAQVANVPLKVGDWEGKNHKSDESEKETFAKAGALAYWSREYRHRKTGAEVTAILMSGPSGPLSVHTPDVCYPGAGYAMKGEAERHSFGEQEFWKGTFVKGKPLVTGQLIIFWSWNCQGRWQAPDNPRFTFRGQPYLYKFYVIHQSTQRIDTEDTGVVEQFIQDFLPELKKSLYSGNTS